MIKKKYNELKSKYNYISNELNIVANEKILIHRNILKLDIYKIYFQEIFSILKISNQGLLNNKIINLLKIENDFIFDENINPFDITWSIYDKNKILVTLIKQYHEVKLKTYTGSLIIKENINKNETRTIHASYSHPKPYIWTESKTNLFIDKLNDLKFQYNCLSKINIFKNNKSYQPFENSNFEKSFNWYETMKFKLECYLLRLFKNIF